MPRSRIAFLITLLLIGVVNLHADTITHFQAIMNSNGIIHGGVLGTVSQATGIGSFTLTEPDGNPGATTLSYFVEFNGVDLDGAQTANILDDVTGIHFHDVRECLVTPPGCIPGDTAGTHHLLNVYGFPGAHDHDLVVNASASTIQGLWDDGDATSGSVHSHRISDMETLDALFGGYAFLIVHTNEVPGGAFGGLLTVVPEPTSGVVGPLVLAMTFLRRRLA